VNVSAQHAAWLQRQLDAAKGGKTGWVSRLMQEVIPFNRPHRLTIQSLSEERCEVVLPFRRRNLNHVGTMHACALATAAEYASGLCVLSAFGVGHVRLVMSNLQISYSKRGDSACVAEAELPSEMLKHVQTQLNDHGRCSFELHAVVRDAADEVVAEAQITWHLKAL
jgi:acyl-coenzyme A thioesterase PaaI-like protein